MIDKTEAIAIAIRPFSQTSLMVTWLTRDFGRIVTPVKGANRPKSMFLGQIDTGYRSELLFYSRDLHGVHNIRETTPLDCREGLRGNWRAAVAAGYVCSLTAQSVETLLDSQGLFDDLDFALSSLAGGEPPEDAMMRYEFALLARLGLRPNFGRCALCRHGDAANCRFSIPDGHLVCADSGPEAHAANTVALAPELLSALRKAANGVSVSAFSPDVALGIRRFLGLFLGYHLDIAPYCRRAAFAWLDAISLR